MITDQEMKHIICKAIESGVIITRRTEGMTDEEYERRSRENKELGLDAVKNANHEDLGRIVNALRFVMDKEQGRFEDLR